MTPRSLLSLCLTALSLAVAVAIAAVSGMTLAQPAHAETARTAVCTARVPWPDGRKDEDAANLGVQLWMNEQLASGKTQFVSVTNTMQRQSLCACQSDCELSPRAWPERAWPVRARECLAFLTSQELPTVAVPVRARRRRHVSNLRSNLGSAPFAEDGSVNSAVMDPRVSWTSHLPRTGRRAASRLKTAARVGRTRPTTWPAGRRRAAPGPNMAPPGTGGRALATSAVVRSFPEISIHSADIYVIACKSARLNLPPREPPRGRRHAVRSCSCWFITISDVASKPRDPTVPHHRQRSG